MGGGITPDHVEPWHRLAEDLLVEEANAIAIQFDGAPAAIVNEPLEVGIELIDTERIGTVVDEVSETPDGAAVGVDGLGGLAVTRKGA